MLFIALITNCGYNFSGGISYGQTGNAEPTEFMSIGTFFNSYMGIYATQAFFHSLIAALIADRALAIWQIRDPAIKQRFSLIAVLFPLFSVPLFHLINPARTSISFRLDALFDSSRWMNMAIVGTFSLGWIFAALLVITSLIFLLQELIPIIQHVAETRIFPQDAKPAADDPAVAQIIEGLPADRPDIFILDDEPLLFSRTGSRAAIFLSTGLVKHLNTEQLQAAIAHEIAHVRRNKMPLLTVVFILRVLVFFNPIALLEFRRAVHEEEKVCDNIAVAMTGKPQVLAQTLRIFLQDRSVHEREEEDGQQTIEEQGHLLLLEERIRRLEEGEHLETRSGWTVFSLTIAAITAVTYFIV